MRTSAQRDLVLKIVNNNFNHLSAIEIYDIAKKIIKNISLGTVYRNINQLCDNNLIKRIKCSDNIDRFDNVKKSHSHFICNKCGKIEDIFENLFVKDAEFQNNKITEYDLVLKGICSECQKKED